MGKLKILTTLFATLVTLQVMAIVLNDGFSRDKSRKWAQKQKFNNVAFILADFGDGMGGKKGTGVLIHPNAVLTSAHTVRAGQCVRVFINFNPDNGEELADDDKPFRITSRIIVHPEHGMDAKGICHGTDLAILVFDEPILPIIKPIEILRMEFLQYGVVYWAMD